MLDDVVNCLKVFKQTCDLSLRFFSSDNIFFHFSNSFTSKLNICLWGKKKGRLDFSQQARFFFFFFCERNQVVGRGTVHFGSQNPALFDKPDKNDKDDNFMESGKKNRKGARQ